MIRAALLAAFLLFVHAPALGEPFRLAARHDLLLPFGIEGGAVSPDGTWFAAQGAHAEGLIVVRIATNVAVRRFRTPTSPIRQFGLGVPYAAPAPVWDPRSKFIWAADADTTRSGFPVGPLQPAKAILGDNLPVMLAPSRRRDDPPNDALERLKSLEHPAGLLDALLWAGDRGRAFAQFGSKAWLRSLDETAERPAFAMVDAESGSVLASLPFAEALAPLATPGAPLDRIKVFAGAATTLPDGRMRLFAVMRARKSRNPDQWLQTWMIWTEGESPKLLPEPYAGINLARYSLAPDGVTVLVVLPLGPNMECGRIGGCRVTEPPVEGPLVVAHDLSTGAVQWTVRATAAAPENRRTPAISPDGRFALVQLPAPAVGVVDMADGRVLQTMPSHPYASFGFFRDGRCAFIQAPDYLAVYERANLRAEFASC